MPAMLACSLWKSRRQLVTAAWRDGCTYARHARTWRTYGDRSSSPCNAPASVCSRMPDTLQCIGHKTELCANGWMDGMGWTHGRLHSVLMLMARTISSPSRVPFSSLRAASDAYQQEATVRTC